MDDITDKPNYKTGVPGTTLASTNIGGVHTPHVSLTPVPGADPIPVSISGSSGSITPIASEDMTGSSGAGDVTLTITPPSGKSVVIDRLSWSYAQADAIAGEINITTLETIVFRINITQPGAGFLPLSRKGAPDQVFAAKLGGVGVQAYLNVDYHIE